MSECEPSATSPRRVIGRLTAVSVGLFLTFLIGPFVANFIAGLAFWMIDPLGMLVELISWSFYVIPPIFYWKVVRKWNRVRTSDERSRFENLAFAAGFIATTLVCWGIGRLIWCTVDHTLP